MVITVIVPEGRNYYKSSREPDVNRSIETNLLYKIEHEEDSNCPIGTKLL
jgi:hypothetical protein